MGGMQHNTPIILAITYHDASIISSKIPSRRVSTFRAKNSLGDWVIEHLVSELTRETPKLELFTRQLRHRYGLHDEVPRVRFTSGKFGDK